VGAIAWASVVRAGANLLSEIRVELGNLITQQL
jgi:hypothetical protein